MYSQDTITSPRCHSKAIQPTTAAEFWRSASPKPDSEEIAETLTPAQIASATDLNNHILTAWEVPEKHRSYLLALIGTSRGSLDWFEATDFRIGRKARDGSGKSDKRQAVEKWTQRIREDFTTWQQDYGRTLAETMPGGQAHQVHYQSRYRLKNYFEIALATERQAMESRDWDRNPDRARRKAAKAVYEAKRHELNQPPNRKRFKPRKENCDLYLKLIATYTNKLCGQALLENRNLPELFLAITYANITKLCESKMVDDAEAAEMLYMIELNAHERRLQLTKSPQLENPAQPTEPIELNPHDRVDTFVHRKTAEIEPQFVHIDQESYMDNLAPNPSLPEEESHPHDSLPVAVPPDLVDGPLELEIRTRGPVNQDDPDEAVTAIGGCDSSSGIAAPEEIEASSAFQSVGCNKFEWFFVNQQDQKEGPYNPVTPEEFKAEISELISTAAGAEVSFVARVRGPVLQLDDCDLVATSLLEPFCFLTVETSENNFQCWLAFHEGEDKAAVRGRLFEALRELAPGVNPGAGGALRWPGSINFKPERNRFRVRLHSINPGRFVTPAELEDAGLLADLPAGADSNWQADGAPGAWPDYERCVESKTVEGVCDRSRADAQYVYFALRRRRTPEEIAAKLLEVSPRAKESGEGYIARTVAAGVEYLGQSI